MLLQTYMNIHVINDTAEGNYVNCMHIESPNLTAAAQHTILTVRKDHLSWKTTKINGRFHTFHSMVPVFPETKYKPLSYWS